MNFNIEIKQIKTFLSTENETKLPIAVKIFLFICLAIILIIRVVGFPFLFFYIKIAEPFNKSVILPIRKKYFRYDEKQKVIEERKSVLFTNEFITIKAKQLKLYPEFEDIIEDQLYKNDIIKYYDDAEIYKITSTNPQNNNLEGMVISDFIFDKTNGIFFQEFTIEQNEFKTFLVFYSYRERKIERIKEIGNYILFLDNSSHIFGFNKKEEIEIFIQDIEYNA